MNAHAESARPFRPVPKITLEIDENRTVDLNGPINTISAGFFLEQFAYLDDGKPILIRISSPGGSIADGLDIIKAIQAAKSPVTCLVDNYAASMAALIAAQCPKLVMHKYGLLMFHEYSTSIEGSRKQLKSRMDLIESLWEAIMQDLSEKSGIPRAELDALVANDWWLNAQEAADYKFINNIVDHYKVTKKNTDLFQEILKFLKPSKEVY